MTKAVWRQQIKISKQAFAGKSPGFATRLRLVVTLRDPAIRFEGMIVGDVRPT
jgi:hypothetical protein